MLLASFADIHALLARWPAGTKRHLYSLDHMYQLMEFLGNPHRCLRVIHVAGTSGKTSTAYYVAALLRAAGMRAGLTISPHAYEINERVQIDLEPLPEPVFTQRFSTFLQLVRRSGVTPNYFELFLSFALWEFAARRVDYAVVEVGIGGLLDSSNVLTRADKICVITDIGYDHTQVLGQTLPEIAAQKAGIIHLQNAVFFHAQSKAVDEVICKRAMQKQADLHQLERPDLPRDFDFLPPFQRRNFSLAWEAASFVLERDGAPPLDQAAVLRAAHTRIPGRMEVSRLGNKTLILDGSHNAQKIQALMASVKVQFPGQPVAAMVRSAAQHGSSTRRLQTGLAEITAAARHIIFTSLGPNDKGYDPGAAEALCRQAGKASFEAIADPAAAYRALLARQEPILLVTGSFFLFEKLRTMFP